MFRPFCLSFLLLGLLSCGRFEHEDIPPCASHEDCPQGQLCREGFCTPREEPRPCPSPQQLCGETCVDLQTNPSHCGRCNTLCPPEATCWQGACVSPRIECPSPQQFCGETCVDLQTNTFHCGRCNTLCPPEATCWQGACVSPLIGCPLPQQLCGEDCVSWETDSSHCGGCNQTCTGGACRDGQCVCPEGMSLCEGRCKSAEDYKWDSNHCGACGKRCRNACLLGFCWF